MNYCNKKITKKNSQKNTKKKKFIKNQKFAIKFTIEQKLRNILKKK